MPQPTTTREAKECFVLSDKAKVLANRDVSSFQKELVALKDVVHRMTNPQLDSVLDWRAPVYDQLTWKWGTATIDEVGVWPMAGGLPADLCMGSARETATGIKKRGGIQALPVPYGDSRAKNNIPGMITIASVISKERLLSVIAEVGGTHRPTPPYLKQKWDLNDGSIRSVALALARMERLNAFFGV